MKRVLTFLALMLLPLSVMAMTPVSDSTLSDVTGQAGVNINANLTMDITMGTLAWGDSDGVPLTAGSGGFVGVSGLNITNLVIKARTESTDTYGSNAFGTYSAYSTDPRRLRLCPIMIDVARDASGNLNDGKTFVRIGLGSLQIKMGDLTMDVALGKFTTGTNAVHLNEVMGRVFIGGMNMYISPASYVDIFSHDNCGVTMSLNVIIDKLALTAVSWGDTDGLTGGNPIVGSSPAHNWFDSNATGGYVGLTDIYLGSISIVGRVAIDVATTTTDPANSVYLEHYREKLAYGKYMSDFFVAYPSATPAEIAARVTAYSQTSQNNYLTGGINAATPSLTIIHFTFGKTGATGSDFVINVKDIIRGTVRLNSEKDLVVDTLGANQKGTELGDIYISGMNVSIDRGSWVDIWAH